MSTAAIGALDYYKFSKCAEGPPCSHFREIRLFLLSWEVNQKDKKKAAHLEETIFLEWTDFIMLSKSIGKSDHY